MQLQSTGIEVLVGSVGHVPNGQTPDIATLNNGNVVVVWAETLERPTSEFDDVDGAVFARIFSPDGEPLADAFQVNAEQKYHPFIQDAPQVVAREDGGFALAWNHTATFGDHPTDLAPFIRYYDADGEAQSDEPLNLLFNDIGLDAHYPMTELVALSENRVGIILSSGDILMLASIDSAEEEPLLLGADERSENGILGYADMAEMENGNMVWAYTPADLAFVDHVGDVVISISAPDFSTPVGIAGVTVPTKPVIPDPISFYVHGEKSLPNADVELAGIVGGGFAVAYSERVDNDSSSVRVDIFSKDGTMPFRATPVVSRTYEWNSEYAEIDMITLQGGGLAMAVTSRDDDGIGHGIDILLLDADGTVLSRLQASQSDIGDQQSPSLTELNDGRIALTFSDTSGNAIGGEADTLRMAIFELTDDSGNFVGTDGNDDLAGMAGNDRLHGGAGNDNLRGHNGADSMWGDAGNDKLWGGNGNDYVVGGTGDDLVYGGKGDDGLNGKAGKDRLWGDDGDDNMNGHTGKDSLWGGLGDDILRGGDGNDSLFGDLGSDVLRGGAGGDTLKGGSGQDRLHGGAGTDTLTGGASADKFVFAGAFGDDRVTDFDVTGADADLIRFVSGNNEAGNFTQFMNNATQVGDDVVYDKTATANTLTLEGVDLSDLSASLFQFV